MPITENPFTPGFEDLPGALAIFPLERALLLPRQELPLNIFEPRYLQMTLDALASTRLIGMIQPKIGSTRNDPVPLYQVGCAGRITFFQETNDGRFLIQLTGVCRFQVAEEIASDKPYRSIRPNWRPFMHDLSSAHEAPLGFDDLEPRLKRYAAAHQLQVRWEALKDLPSAELIDFLSTQLPFDVAEKQALVEAQDVATRAEVLSKAIEIGTQSGQSAPSTRH